MNTAARGPSKRTMPHHCHAHGCTREVPPKMFMCKPHWFRLRAAMQRAIWREYRPGQERDKNPSQRYLAVQRLAVAEVAFIERLAAQQKLKDPGQRERAAAETSKVMAPYLLAAMSARATAIKAGDGDPLEGLVPNLPAVAR